MTLSHNATGVLHEMVLAWRSDREAVPDGGSVHLQREKLIVKITSGCAAVDEILGGGFETKSISEIYGEYRLASFPSIPCVKSTSWITTGWITKSLQRQLPVHFRIRGC